MTSDSGADRTVAWWKAEPGRLDQDRREIEERFPGLVWQNEPDRAVRDAGGWRGRLPIWPFERPRPAGLDNIGPGLSLELVYPQAYPMVAPQIYPVAPSPELMHFTDHRWHLNGDGSLCLLQQANQWTGRDSVVDLLLKAAGWRVEFALMQAGLVEAMSENGIVSTNHLDPLISYHPALAAPPATTATS